MNAGTLRYGISNAISSGDVAVLGATFDLNGYSDTIGALTMTGGAVTTAAGTLTLGGNVTTNASANSATISGNLDFGSATRTFTIADGTAADDMSISAVISSASGAYGITKAGSGTMVLSAANTYTGTVTVNAGVLNIQHAAALGATDGATSVTSGAALQLQGCITVGAEALTLNGSGISSNGALRNVSGNNTWQGNVTLGAVAPTLTCDSGTNLTISGIISGSTTLTKNGTGTLILSGANNYTGATTVSAGALNIRHSSALGTIDGATTVSSGAALQLQGNITVGAETLSLAGTGVSSTGALRNISGNNVWQGAVALSTTPSIASDAGSLTISGIISGSTTLTKNGTGTLILSGANSYTGATTVSAGVLNIQNATATGTTAGGVTVSSGATLQLQGGITVGAEALTLNGAGINNDGALRNISGDNTWQGNLTLASASRINSDSGTLALSGTLPCAYVINIGGAGNTNISGVISGSSGLIKDGSGTLTFSGGSANTLSGTITVNAGELDLNKTAGTNAFAGNLTIGDSVGGLNADIVKLLAANQIPAIIININNSGKLDLNNNSDVIGTLNITGGNITTGAGILTLGGNLTGNADVNTATISGNLDFGSATRTFTIADGTAANDMLISAVISSASGAYGITKAGAGILALSGLNTYTGITTLSAGTLNVSTLADGGSNCNIGASGNSAANLVFNGGTLLYAGPAVNTDRLITLSTAVNSTIDSSGTGALTFTNTGSMGFSSTGIRTLTITGSNNLSLAFVIGDNSGATSITKNGSGTLTLNATNTYSGVTTVNAGTIIYGANNAIPSTSSITIVNGSVNLNGFSGTTVALTMTGGSLATGAGTLTMGAGHITANASTATATVSGNLNLGTATKNFTVNDNMTISAVISSPSGAYGVSKAGVGILVLSGASTYTGQTSVAAGILVIQHNTALGGTASNATAVSSGACLQMQGGITVGTESLTLTGTGIASDGALRNISGNNTWQGTILLSSDSIIGSDAGNLTISGVVSGSSALTKNGAGTLTLSGINTYNGATTINAGILNIQNANATGTVAGGVVVATGAALQIQGDITVGNEALTLRGSGIASDGALRNISGNNTWQGAVTLGNIARIQSDSGTLTLSAAISGAYSLTKSGAGTLTLSAVNTFTGATTISAGTLTYGINNALYSGTVTIASGATLDLNGYNLTTAGTTSFTNNGTLKLKGSETVNTPANATGSLVQYYGTSGPYTLKNWAYYSLLLSSA